MEASRLIPLAVGIVSLCGAGVGVATWADSRYAHSDDITRLAQNMDRRAIENELATKRLELQALRAKPNPTPEDLDRIGYLIKITQLLQQQLDGIAGG